MTLPTPPAEPGIDDGLCVPVSLGATRLIWLNQPNRRNALSPDLRAALKDLLAKAMQDDTVRAIVICGAQGNFSAGGDLSTMKGITSVAGRERMNNAADLMRVMVQGPKPIVAAVEGWCVGAGMSLAAACDIVVAAPDAKFSLPFGKLGLIPDLGSLHTLSARIGMGRTKWLAFTRRTIDAQTAMNWGAVEDIAEEGATLFHALALAEEITAGAPLTNSYTKQLLARLPMGFDEYLAAERDTQAILYTSEDFDEGIDSFFEKRPAVFNGK
ncbi:enoyl-CoA hydratase/isomerase family protein [Thalassovita sp.]|uniref:enoyl-CoA hydratase/isomerase family protein n=1 Tax=Thalassovita sp. TaxID=1979401 RepID=UPI002B2754BD|nr:enoyl-CoA hydratase/isomerase family protein [Thalassovita sp.]